MARKKFSLFILSSLFILLPITALGYQWPVSPFNSQHPINATLGEYRTSTRFHGGVDIGKPEGTKVYPVVSGKVKVVVPTGKNSYVKVKVGEKEYDYVHINPLVKEEDDVIAGVTVLGTINSENHLHFEEDNGAVNPLRSGGLTPFTDKGDPEIEKIEVVKDGTPGTGEPFPKDKDGIPIVSGKVDIKAWAYDPRINADGSAGGKGVGIYKIGYEIRKEDGTLIEGPIHRIQFDTISGYEVSWVYVPGSSYDPVNFIYWATNNPSSNGYWDTMSLGRV